MSRHNPVWQWSYIVSTHLPHLSRPQAHVLALWSYGIALSHTCGMTTVVVLLAQLLGQRENTVRQRLREWCYDAADKRGSQRQAVEVGLCFAPLLRWVLSWWAGEERRLALALDATTLGARFTVLAISVVYRGCAIPVAWKVVRAQAKGAWAPHWKALLAHLETSVPVGWTVLVLADRGLYARWLYEAIQHLGWHPFLRVNAGGTYRPTAGGTLRPLGNAVREVGERWCGEVVCFQKPKRRLACTLVACWEAEHQDRWLVLTDLLPEQAQVAWYALRAWIEAGFKDIKRGGWQWQQTRMTDPERASRLWLAMSVATLWAVSVGGAADAMLPASSVEALPPTHLARRRAAPRARTRQVSCFRRGLLLILATLVQGRALPLGQFHPEPWPNKQEASRLPQGHSTQTRARKTYP
jgi:hypothetical protein